MTGSGFLTLLMNFIGPMVLLAAIMYLVWRGRPSWRSRQHTETATKELYKREEAARQRVEEPLVKRGR
jgi:hypothetical protein